MFVIVWIYYQRSSSPYGWCLDYDKLFCVFNIVITKKYFVSSSYAQPHVLESYVDHRAQYSWKIINIRVKFNGCEQQVWGRSFNLSTEEAVWVTSIRVSYFKKLLMAIKLVDLTTRSQPKRFDTRNAIWTS